MSEYTKAMVLLSGGLDSTTALAWALDCGYDIVSTISFTYGQTHVREIDAAQQVAAHYHLPHHVIALPALAGSPLTTTGVIPQARDLTTLVEDRAPTYVPNRNMIFLAHAAAVALVESVSVLIGGWNATDAHNYPDCRDSFLAATEQTLRLATLHPFSILRPLIHESKAQIIARAQLLEVPVALTWTCYVGDVVACGQCDACQVRRAAFETCGIPDPMIYA